MPYFEPLTKHHRVTLHGRLVRCPHCSHVSRVYTLSWSTHQCLNCKASVFKYDWAVGPNVTRKDLQPTYRWKAQYKRGGCTFGKTKKILMSRLSHPESEYIITKEELPGWSRPDLVLVIDRRFDAAVQVFSDTYLPQEQSLEWADSSGSRSVHLFMINGEQVDLPHRTFQMLKDYLTERYIDIDLLMHREDPGLGIFLPELDEAVMEAV